jgi:hypothetical protein
MLTVAWDPSSLGWISHLPSFQPVLAQYISQELLEVGDMLQSAMDAKTWEVFTNPTGQLAESIRPFLESPLTLIIDVEVPYAWRMEMGFFGKDSLGRLYAEEGKPYAEPSLQDNETMILQMLNLAAAEAVADFKASQK